MITIKKINSGDPIKEFPQLLTIWPEPSNTVMQEGIRETLDMMEQYPEVDEGALCLILKDNNVIGLTGFFCPDNDGNFTTYNQERTIVYLRWHGFIPEQRGKNYSEQVIELVLKEALKHYPNLQTLVELIPQTPYKEYLEKHFTNMGFIKTGTAESYDWSKYLWQPFHLHVPDFIQRCDLNNHSNIINIKSKNKKI